METNSSIIKPTTRDQLPNIGESQSNLTPRNNAAAMMELGYSRNKPISEMAASSPSKDSNPFLRSVPNFDDVVLSPTYKNPPSEVTPVADSPEHLLGEKPKFKLDSNEDIQEILETNTPFMDFVRKQTETKEMVQSFVRQQSQKRFVKGIGEFIAQGLGLNEDGEQVFENQQQD